MNTQIKISEIPKSFLPGLMVFLSISAMFYWAFGILILRPDFIDWIMIGSSDRITYFLSWAHFRYEDWHWPLGKIENYCFPSRNSVGLNDAIPIVAIPLKLLHSYLPQNFQYFGPWIFLCYFLMGYSTSLFLRSVGIKQSYLRGLGGIFLVITPFLLCRFEHMALNAHWLLILGLVYYSYSLKRYWSIRKTILHLVFLQAIAAAIHPYLSLQSWAIIQVILAIELYENKRLDKVQYLMAQLAIGLTLLIVWYLCGYFELEPNHMNVGGFGLFSSNLNTFFNPLKASRILPELPILEAQYEGMGFLGISGLLLLFAALVNLLAHPRNKLADWSKHRFLFGLALAFFLYAISNKIVLNDMVLFQFNLPRYVEKITSVFRAGGRFIWFPAYLLILTGLVTFLRSKLAIAVKSVLLIALLVLQYWDIYPQYEHLYLRIPTYEVPFDTGKIFPIFKSSKMVLTYPPFKRDNVFPYDYHYWAYLAAHSEKPVTTGYVGRVDHKSQQAFEMKLKKQIQIPELGDFNNTAIVVHDSLLNAFQIWKDHNLFQRTPMNGYSILQTNEN